LEDFLTAKCIRYLLLAVRFFALVIINLSRFKTVIIGRLAYKLEGQNFQVSVITPGGRGIATDGIK
jgi:hypothetical protein